MVTTDVSLQPIWAHPQRSNSQYKQWGFNSQHAYAKICVSVHIFIKPVTTNLRQRKTRNSKTERLFLGTLAYMFRHICACDVLNDKRTVSE